MEDIDNQVVESVIAASGPGVALTVLAVFLASVALAVAYECDWPELSREWARVWYGRVTLALLFLVSVPSLMYAVFWAFMVACGRPPCG